MCVGRGGDDVTDVERLELQAHILRRRYRLLTGRVDALEQVVSELALWGARGRQRVEHVHYPETCRRLRERAEAEEQAWWGARR